VLGFYRYKDLTLLLNRNGRMDEARKCYDKVKGTWEAIVQEEPTNRKYWSHLAVSYLWGAEDPMTDQGSSEAEKLYGRAIDLFAEIIRDDPNDVSAQAHLAEAYEGLALLLASTGQSAGAVQGYRDAIDGYFAKSLSENRLREGDSPILLPGHRKIGTDPADFKIGFKSNDQSASSPQKFDRAALHARLALQLALTGQDKDALDGEVRQAVALAPGDIAIQLLCADAFGVIGAWREAADFHSRADEASRHEWWIMSHRPRLLLAAGDSQGYRAACA